MVGCFGFIMNSITLYVLTRQKLKKMFFNKLLICLAIFDTLFIINSIYESYRLNMTKTNYCSMQGYVLLVLYPFRQIVLCCSIYMTIMLAFERYLAVSKPITYRRQSITKSENKRLHSQTAQSQKICFLFVNEMNTTLISQIFCQNTAQY